MLDASLFHITNGLFLAPMQIEQGSGSSACTYALCFSGMRNECIHQREDLLSIDDSRLGCDKRSQQGLDAALPAPEGGVVGL